MRSVFAWMLVAVLACACVMLFVSFQLGFFLLVFAAAGWWAWENPEEGFLFLIIAFPLLPLFKVTQTTPSFTLIKDVIIAVLFFRLFVLPLLGKRLPYRRSVLFGPIAVLITWTLFETFRADSLTLGVLRARDIILYILLYFIALYLPASREIWKRRLMWFLASFLVTVFHGAYQWFFAGDSAVLRFDPGRQIWIPRISSTFGHPSVYGEYLIAAAVLFLAIVLCRPHFAKASSLRQGFGRQARGRLLFAALFLLALPLIFLTYSRAVWIGFAAAVGVMGTFWLSSKFKVQSSKELQKSKYLLVAAGVMILFSVFSLLRFTPAGPLLRSAFDPTYKSNEERLEFAARLVAPMSNLDAMFGRGLGDVTAQQLRKVEIGAEEITSGAARDVQLAKDATLVDNQYLKTFVEMGLIGLVIYGWLFWRFAQGSWQLLHGPYVHLRSVHRVIRLWGLGFLAAFVVQALLIDIWDIFPTNAMFWIIGGFISTALTPEARNRA